MSSELPERVTPANERAFLLAELQHVLDNPTLHRDPEAELARLHVALRALSEVTE